MSRAQAFDLLIIFGVMWLIFTVIAAILDFGLGVGR